MHLNSEIWVLRHRKTGMLMGPGTVRDTIGDPGLFFVSRAQAELCQLRNRQPHAWEAVQITGMYRPVNEIPPRHLASVR